MSPDAYTCLLSDPTEWWLEIPSNLREPDAVHPYSSPFAAWRAYLNRASLGAVLPLLQEECASRAGSWPIEGKLSPFWECLNGTAVRCGNLRLVIVPSEATDCDELRVPWEWVDIPIWAADYYLAVRVVPEHGHVHLWGYTTHQQLTQAGTRDLEDRTYSLDGTALVRDLNILWVSEQLCPEVPRRGSIEAPALPLLGSNEARSLLHRLGSAHIYEPRLAIPFEPWAALITNDHWRQRLYELRNGLAINYSVIEWLRGRLQPQAWESGWRIPRLEGARSKKPNNGEPIAESVMRHLVIAGQAYELTIQLTGQLNHENRWSFKLKNVNEGGRIPGGFKLRLLTTDRETFENNEDVAVTAADELEVVVALTPGEGLVWEIEPIPERYEPEILYF